MERDGMKARKLLLINTIILSFILTVLVVDEAAFIEALNLTPQYGIRWTAYLLIIMNIVVIAYLMFFGRRVVQSPVSERKHQLVDRLLKELI